MKVIVYSAKDFEIPFIEKANRDQFQIKYIPEKLDSKTAQLAIGFDVVSIFSGDDGSTDVLKLLKDFGVEYLALRSTGYDNVNIKAAKNLGLKVANTAGYSPFSIAEHAIALLFALRRNMILAQEQVRNYNFSLSNLVSKTVHQKKVGIIGTGRIGKVIAEIMSSLGCEIVAFDKQRDIDFASDFKIMYYDLETLCKQSDIIFICTPLNSETHYLINKELIDQMKNGVVLINIARGAIVNTEDLLEGLKNKKIGAYGTDVYEYETNVFFYDLSHSKTFKDPLLKSLIDLPNVIITPHQAFATKEALTCIAKATIGNIDSWSKGLPSVNELTERLG